MEQVNTVLCKLDSTYKRVARSQKKEQKKNKKKMHQIFKPTLTLLHHQ